MLIGMQTIREYFCENIYIYLVVIADWVLMVVYERVECQSCWQILKNTTVLFENMIEKHILNDPFCMYIDLMVIYTVFLLFALTFSSA